MAVLRVPRRFGTPLAEVLNVFHGEIIPGQMQQGVEKHGSVSVGKNEAVSVCPSGILGIHFHFFKVAGGNEISRGE